MWSQYPPWKKGKENVLFSGQTNPNTIEDFIYIYKSDYADIDSKYTFAD